MFEPKPQQLPHPPVSIGGESAAALRRAAAHDGWIGLDHSPESAGAAAERLAALRREAGRSDLPFVVTVGASPADPDEVERYAAAGVDRLIVSPWRRTRDVPTALVEFARRFFN